MAWPSAAAGPRPTGETRSDTFRVRVHRLAPDHMTVELAGELDLATGDLLSAVLRDREGRRRVRLDAAELAFVDCAGLRVIEQAQAELAAEGAELTLVHVAPRVRRVMRLAGLEQLLCRAPAHRESDG